MPPFSRASQFVAVDMWRDPVPFVLIVFTTFVVNLRHLLMGASLQRNLDRFTGPSRLLAMFLLTDESWAFAERKALSEALRPAYYFGVASAMWLVWTSASLAGAMAGLSLGNQLIENEKGEVFLTGMFSKNTGRIIDGFYALKLEESTGWATKYKNGFYEIPVDLIKSNQNRKELRKLDKEEEKDDSKDVGVTDLIIRYSDFTENGDMIIFRATSFCGNPNSLQHQLSNS